ncbi:MAG: cell wall hydrolase [Magnetospirillum sp.]|nr:cell wall hydrolase [Magnetospirillum sp.]
MSSRSSPPPLPAAAPAPAPEPAKTVPAAELRCLALNVYWESRGQPLAGQAAVAHVTLNRTRSPSFPATICGVVHQGCQFGWTCDKRSNKPADGPEWQQAMEVAREAVAGGDDPTGGALYFHHVQERPQWARGRYGNKVVIGQHVFFNVAGAQDQQVAEAGR